MENECWISTVPSGRILLWGDEPGTLCRADFRMSLSGRMARWAMVPTDLLFLCRIRRRIGFFEVQRRRVDAITQAGRFRAIVEDVAEMAAAMRA